MSEASEKATAPVSTPLLDFVREKMERSMGYWYFYRWSQRDAFKHITCPCCTEEYCTMKLRLKLQFGFSNLKCQACSQTTAASSWRCPLGSLWYKRRWHVHEAAWNQEGPTDEGRKQQKG